MKVLVHDFSGHPFQVQLSRELARRGHSVEHLYSRDYSSGHGAMSVGADDPSTLQITGLSLGREFAKYRIGRRLAYEVAYGWALARHVARRRPDVVLACNEPLLAKVVLGLRCSVSSQPWVFWLQDLYSVAMAKEAQARLPVLGRTVGRGFEWLERRLLRSADAVVPITDAFVTWMQAHGISTESTTVIPNWAPLDEIQYHVDEQQAFEALGVPPGAAVALYAGTLGRKHDASRLLEAAEAIAPIGGHLVVISEGEAADHLRAEGEASPGLPLHVVPFQPWDGFSELLASARVFVAILEPDAGGYSVPSKVLTYVAAGRPIVGLLPPQNEAASMIRAIGGLVVDYDDPGSLGRAVADMLGDTERSARVGRAGRAFAEDAFDIERIADRFEQLLGRAAAGQRKGMVLAHHG